MLSAAPAISDDDYEPLQPYWEAWKMNTRRPSGAVEATLCDTMLAMFHAVAEGRSDVEAPEAFACLRAPLPEWREWLKALGR